MSYLATVAWSKVKHFGPYIFFQECYSFSCYIWSIVFDPFLVSGTFVKNQLM